MIVVKLTGGLGNQLFQYAMGRYLASRTHAELVLDDSFYVNIPLNSTPRSFELAHYAIQARRTNAAERRALKTYSGRFWKRFRRILPTSGALRYVHEPAGQYIPHVRNLGDGVFLDGYWQSEGYFSGVDDLIRSEFSPLHPMSPQDQQMADQIQASDSISLHIRRGDYLTNSAANALHGLCDLSYYERAASFLGERVKQPVFFIFSDDLNWVRDNLRLPFPCVYVGHNSASMAVQDLRLMSLCRHHIIANSSFSWWGAWLNPSPEKIVVRPQTWYVGLPQAGAWTCPARWIAL